MDVGGRQSLSQPRPPDEQPYLKLSSVDCCSLETKLGNYWILWLNNMMHLGLWQWTGSTDPWSGACNVDGSVNPNSDVLPAPLLTSWAEEHGATTHSPTLLTALLWWLWCTPSLTPRTAARRWRVRRGSGGARAGATAAGA